MSADLRDTIFALSSGALPAGVAVVRVSGPDAAGALVALAGSLPEPRRASTATLRWQDDLLDRALILWLPGPGTATGEDVAELHLHGGRAVVAAVLAALGAQAGLRLAEPGEFTRRAFSNGKLDLAQAEGLADLLTAETEAQRRQALRQAEGGLGKLIGAWRTRLLALAARVEAAIEFAEDEDDIPVLSPADLAGLAALAQDMRSALAHPPAERLRDGVRIVVAGPTNAGKSSIINTLSGRDAAITSAVAGTTRDLIEVPVSIAGMPCLLIDSAGLRDEGAGQVEKIGMARARAAIAEADLILWLGRPDMCPDPERTILVSSKADLPGARRDGISTSIKTGEGLDQLRALLETRVRRLLPPADVVALNARHRERISEAVDELKLASGQSDILFVAEHLRLARVALDRITGQAGVEDMLDALFGQFCIGK